MSASSWRTSRPPSPSSPPSACVQGRAPVEGPGVDRVNGLEGVRVDIAMMRTPDGQGRVELTKFHNPELSRPSRRSPDRNTLGLRQIMLVVEDIYHT